MGKRSNFDRQPRDFYPTPYEAILPLLPHLPPHSRFIEPCCGNGALVRHLEKHGHACTWASDIEAYKDPIEIAGHPVTIQHGLYDALEMDFSRIKADYILTNPPWDRKILHPMIDHFAAKFPTWLLFDADWMHTIQAVPYLAFCQQIVSVGRVKWIAGTKNTGKDNACWHLFDKNYEGPPATEFFGRITS